MNDIKVSQDVTVSQPKPPHMYLVDERDWLKLKRSIRGIVERNTIFQTLGGTCFGLGASAGFALIAFASTRNLPAWVQPTTWAILVCSLCLGIALFVIDNQQNKIAQYSVKAVLDEFEAIESAISPPSTS